MSDPQRMCSACRERASKKDLIRVVRTPDGEIAFNATGKLSGRGAYICRRPECLAKVRKTHALDRMLGISVPPEIYEEIDKILSESDE